MSDHPTSQDVHQLSEQVGELTTEVRVLRDCLDELRTSVEWTTRNARVIIQFERAADASTETPTPIELFQIGDEVTWQLENETLSGEITDLNDGENIARVQLIPSGEMVTVCQDDLTRLRNDPLSARTEEAASIPRLPREGNNPTPAPGQLF